MWINVQLEHREDFLLHSGIFGGYRAEQTVVLRAGNSVDFIGPGLIIIAQIMEYNAPLCNSDYPRPMISVAVLVFCIRYNNHSGV